MKMFVSRPDAAKPFYQLNKPISYTNKSVFTHTDGEDEEIETVFHGNYGQTEIDLTEEEIETCSKITLDFLNTQAKLAFMFHGKDSEYKFLEKYND